MLNLKKGYLPPAVLIFLAILSLFVAGIILFNAQLIRNVKQKDQSQVSTPSAQLNSSAPANWKTYTNNRLGFSFQYPPNLDVNKDQENSVLLNQHQQQPGPTGYPTFYVSVISKNSTNSDYSIYNFWPQETLNSLFGLTVGQIFATQKETYETKYWTFERLSDDLVNNQIAIKVYNPNAWEGGGNDLRLLIKKGDSTYMIGTYYHDSSGLEIFNKILSTFHFTN